MLVLIGIIALPLAVSIRRSLPLTDVIGSLFLAGLHTVWWWLVLPRSFDESQTASIAKSVYIVIVVWAAWDFDTLFSNYAQPFAFAGLLATLLQTPYFPKLDIVEKSFLCYSALINLVVLLSDYVIGGELIYVAQCWLLATVVVGWIHVRLYSIRHDSIHWLLISGKFLFWLGMLGAVCGFSAFPIFLTKAGGMVNLVVTAIMINVGNCGSLAVSIALSLELLSTPTPNRLRLAVGYATCLIWVILFTTWCYLQ